MQMMIPIIAAQCVILRSVVMIVKYLSYYFTHCLVLTIGSGLRFFVSLKKNTKEEWKKRKKQIENVKKGNTEYHSCHFIAFIFVSHEVW